MWIDSAGCRWVYIVNHLDAFRLGYSVATSARILHREAVTIHLHPSMESSKEEQRDP